MEKAKCFINAGHSKYIKGAVHKEYKENEMVIKLRNILLPLLKDYKIVSVPDNLSLKKSIAWVNERANENDFAFSLHFNAHNNSSIRGVEAYYHNIREKKLAPIFSKEISKVLNIPNRGARPDTWTWVGSLGWLRKLRCDSILVEVCYLTNKDDMKAYRADKACRGILNALNQVLIKQDSLKVKKRNELINTLNNLISQLRILLGKYVSELNKRSLIKNK